MATTKTTRKAATKATARRTTAKKTPARKAAVAKTSAKKKAPARPHRRGGKLTALDAAAKVLSESKQPLTARELIDVMAKKKLWTSPGGQTPHATLYSAMSREINAKGKQARFKKSGRGKFTANG